MPKRNLTKHTKHVALSGTIIAVTIGIVLALGLYQTDKKSDVSVGSTQERGAPTNEIGAIDAIGTGQDQDELWLVQRGEKGEKYTRLVLDEKSYCKMGNDGQGIQCMAMSVTFSQVFGGRRARVEGMRDGDEILVRVLHIALGDEMP